MLDPQPPLALPLSVAQSVVEALSQGGCIHRVNLAHNGAGEGPGAARVAPALVTLLKARPAAPRPQPRCAARPAACCSVGAPIPP